MDRFLIVTEKPEMAEKVAGVLGAGVNEVDLLHGIRRYKFQYLLDNVWRDISVVSVRGHFMNLSLGEKDEDCCDPILLLDSVRSPSHKKYLDLTTDIQSMLTEEAAISTHLVIWTDMNEEGENIGSEISRHCGLSNPHLQVRRAVYTPSRASYRHALENLQDPRSRTSEAVDVRQELDLRKGFCYTRFQTKLLRYSFYSTEIGTEYLSYGPCSTEVLAFIVGRCRARTEFKPETFYTITGTDKSSLRTGRIGVFKHMCLLSLLRLSDEEKARRIYTSCTQTKEAWVTEYTKAPRTFLPLPPLSTLELLRRAALYLNIDSYDTMQAAESLRRKGYLSYTRTNDVVSNLTLETAEWREILERQRNNSSWGVYVQSILDSNEELGSVGGNGAGDKADAPIHPIRALTGEEIGWTTTEKQIFEFVTRHCVASFLPPQKCTKYYAVIKVGGESFSATGLELDRDRSFLNVYPYHVIEESFIPTYYVHQRITPTWRFEDETTTAPPLVSEDDILEHMHILGIGTSSTFHQHIKSVTGRGYATIDDDLRYSATKLGLGLINGYASMGVNKGRSNRAHMTIDMHHISQGQLTAANCLAVRLQEYTSAYSEVFGMKKHLIDSLEKEFGYSNYIDICPKGCGWFLALKQISSGNFNVGCLNYKRCTFKTIWLPGCIETARALPVTCDKCGRHKVWFRSRADDIPEHYRIRYTCCITKGCELNLIVKQLRGICGSTKKSIFSRSNPGNQCRYCGKLKDITHVNDFCPLRGNVFLGEPFM